jgi:hypothetical protein
MVQLVTSFFLFGGGGIDMRTSFFLEISVSEEIDLVQLARETSTSSVGSIHENSVDVQK